MSNPDALDLNSNTPRWKRRPRGSNWGDFGPDDQLGRLNLLTREKVLQGIAEVIEGRTFCLSLPLDFPGGNGLNPRRKPPHVRPIMREGKPNLNFPLRCVDASLTDITSDDEVLLCLQYSTQWDGLSHVGHAYDVNDDGVLHDVYYNGFRAGTDVVGPVAYGPNGEETPVENALGAVKLGIENMAANCVQGRGVMIDLEAHFGDSGKIVDYDDLMRIIDADKVEVEKGDMVCFRTGFARRLLEMNREPDIEYLHKVTATLNGRDKKLHNWITDTGLAVVIADNYGVEAVPAKPSGDKCHAFLPLHEHCLFRLGVHLGELWHLSELADWLRANGRYRFLLTAPPLRLPGAVGSPATPVATV